VSGLEAVSGTAGCSSETTRHPFVSVMLVACLAVVAGACSFAAIGQCARNTLQGTLARLGARTLTALGVRLAPARPRSAA
jgi:hypothetical protein